MSTIFSIKYSQTLASEFVENLEEIIILIDLISSKRQWYIRVLPVAKGLSDSLSTVVTKLACVELRSYSGNITSLNYKHVSLCSISILCFNCY